MSAPKNDVHAKRSIAKSMFHEAEILKKRNIAEIKTKITRKIKPTPQMPVSNLQKHS